MSWRASSTCECRAVRGCAARSLEAQPSAVLRYAPVRRLIRETWATGPTFFFADSPDIDGMGFEGDEADESARPE